MRLILFLALFSTGLAFATSLIIGAFSAGDLSGWRAETFSGETNYTLVEEEGRKVLKAQSSGAASGLYREIKIDLEQTPYLNWSWKVAGVLAGVNERTKSGDDYPARVYVVVSSALFWRTRALNYVWSSSQPANSHWDSAYTGNVKMLALRSGAAQAGIWVEEKRNVREDLKRLFGEDITRIDAVALMTDTDNSGQRATAWYGNIYFSAQ